MKTDEKQYWFDPAVAKYDPDDPQSLWCCSVRGGLNCGIVCWAEGETPEETRDRAKTITAALNRSSSGDTKRLIALCETLRDEAKDARKREGKACNELAMQRIVTENLKAEFRVLESLLCAAKDSETANGL